MTGFAATMHTGVSQEAQLCFLDHSHLLILLLGNQFKTASTWLPRAWGGVFRIVFDR